MAARSKSRNRSDRRPADDGGAQAVRDSVQKIWLAGLGALERAGRDGPRVFESLVEQGRNMGARAVGLADEALKNMRQANYSGAPWEKLEQAVQERLTKSIKGLGVAGGAELEELARQVRELNANMRSIMSGEAQGAGKRRTSARKAKARKGGSKARKAASKPRARRGG